MNKQRRENINKLKGRLSSVQKLVKKVLYNN